MHRRAAAFTLVELLVVMAIISLLAGLLLPALEQSLLVARQAACASQLRQIELGLRMYGDEWKDRLPPNTCEAANRSGNYIKHYWTGDIISFGLLVRDYELDRNVLRCPGREEHGPGELTDTGAHADYVPGWPYRGTAHPDKEYPTLGQFRDEGVCALNYTSTRSGTNHKGLSVFVADVRTRVEWRTAPSDIPHGGAANLLRVDGGVTGLPDCFGPTAAIHLFARYSIDTTENLADRNERVYHPYGGDWWYWTESRVQGFPLLP